MSYRTKAILEKCLQSLYLSHPGFNIEVIVIDNASRDGTCEMVRTKYPGIQVVENRTNVGFARANNQALSKCKGKYALLLNSDTEVVGDALDIMTQFMETHSTAGLVNAKLVYPSRELQPSPRKLLSFWKGEVWDAVFWRTPLSRILHKSYARKAMEPDRDYEQVIEIEWARGACLMMRRAVWEDIGPLDPHFFGYEELDYNIRAARAGWKRFYVPNAVVIHHGSLSHRAFGIGIREKISEAMFYYWEKNYGLSYGIALRLLTVGINVCALGLSPLVLAVTYDRSDTKAKLSAMLRQIAVATRNVGRPPPLVGSP